jgi:YidC/Oxa1 family membrane protein insertase
MDENSRNTVLAIVLSLAIIIAWQFFIAAPQIEQERRKQEALQTEQQARPPVTAPGAPGAPGVAVAPAPGAPPAGVPAPDAGTLPTVPGAPMTPQAGPARGAALAETPRVRIDTPAIGGSIALKGGRIDDILLKDYRETVDPRSPNIVLFSPSGSANPYYAEFGWIAGAGVTAGLPGPDTLWTPERSGPLTPDAPLTLTYDNGEGLTFRRTYAVDRNFMFRVDQTVENGSGKPVTLHPYALISRHGMPDTLGYYILHEGLIGVLGEAGLQEVDYDDLLDDGVVNYSATGGWLGITDKYWAATLIPDQNEPYSARMTAQPRGEDDGNFQADYLLPGREIAPGGSATATGHLFAGAKVVNLIDGYEESLGILNFELLIDWGWFYFITKPLFHGIDFFFRLVGNFGVAILIVTVLVKIAFFPLANKSYVSMSRMKLVQPEMVKIRERFKDDRARQQQAMMELYKKEKINPMSGCLPIALQIPVFFALYKVLFVTIEMRHAPFFGWIQDLAAPDPTSLFNLFGLLPIDLPQFLMIGVWPLLMGLTMLIQMRLNPPPPDPTQAMIFNWMPLFFTFLLASFPAGLVIYWTWNNLLSVTQQYVIMRRQGVKIELWDNLKRMIPGKTKAGAKGSE